MAEQENPFQRGPSLEDVAAAVMQPAQPTPEAADEPEEEVQSEVTTQTEEADTEDGGEDDLELLGDGEEEPTEDEEGEEEVDAYQITLDGEDHEVTIDELIKSYQLQGTAQKRLKEASIAKKEAIEEGHREGLALAGSEIEAQRQSLEQQRQQLGQIVSMVGENLFHPTVQKPDPALQQTDPIKFLTQDRAYQDEQMRLMGLKQQLAAGLGQMEAAVEEQRAELRKASQRELARARPELREKEAQQVFTGRVRMAQEQLGFTAEEVNAYPDHRGLLALELAGRYLELMNGQKPATKRIKKKTKTLKPGATKQGRTPGQKKAAADRERAQRTGDIKDVAKLLVQPAR